jgi:hypothetical protein
MSPYQGSSLGDFLRAAHLLDAVRDHNELLSLASLFDISFSATPEAAEEPTVVAPTTISEDEEPLAPKTTRDIPPSRLAPSLPVEIRRLASGNDETLPQWISSAKMLPPPSPRHISEKTSLFEPPWTRAIVTTALSIIEETSEIDVEHLIENIINGRPVLKIAYRRVLMLAPGAYCWVDQSQSMQPYAGDQAQIVGVLRDTVGLQRLSVRRTRGTPSRDSGLVPRLPHLLVSDLGIRYVDGELPPDPPQRWAEWAWWLDRELDARVIAFVPAPPERYPAFLREKCHLVEWDRLTDVQAIRRVLVDHHD